MAPHILLADPKGNAWSLTERIHALLEARAGTNSFKVNPVDITRYRDGEFRPQVRENVRKHSCFFIHDSSKDPSSWFTELVLVSEALCYASGSEVTAVLPYMRFARQDKKDDGRVSIAMRAVAEVLGLYADRVLTIDIHNFTEQGMFRIPMDSLSSFPVAARYLRKHYPDVLRNLVVMAPDAGGAKRAESFAKHLGDCELVIGHKVRPSPGEVSSYKLIGEVAGKDVLIVDDIIDSGNTMIAAAQTARQNGAHKVYAYATHGLFTKGIDSLCSSLDRLFVGDTMPLPQSCDAVAVIDFAPLLAEAIYRTAQGESISALFARDGADEF